MPSFRATSNLTAFSTTVAFRAESGYQGRSSRFEQVPARPGRPVPGRSVSCAASLCPQSSPRGLAHSRPSRALGGGGGLQAGSGPPSRRPGTSRARRIADEAPRPPRTAAGGRLPPGAPLQPRRLARPHAQPAAPAAGGVRTAPGTRPAGTPPGAPQPAGGLPGTPTLTSHRHRNPSAFREGHSPQPGPEPEPEAPPPGGDPATPGSAALGAPHRPPARPDAARPAALRSRPTPPQLLLTSQDARCLIGRDSLPLAWDGGGLRSPGVRGPGAVAAAAWRRGVPTWASPGPLWETGSPPLPGRGGYTRRAWKPEIGSSRGGSAGPAAASLGVSACCGTGGKGPSSFGFQTRGSY